MTDAPSPSTGENPVVTIFEQYGAGADAIGRAVAEKLGYPYHQQAFSSAALEGGSDTALDSLENRAMLAQVFAVMGGAYGGFAGRDVVTTQAEKRDLVSRNNDDVRRFAREGGVIVGRNAALILASRPRTVHVLLTGDLEDRIQRAAKADGISVEQARTRQRREDRVRRDMSEILYGWDPMQADRYDLVINTSRIRESSAVAAIVDAVRAAEAE
jgi:glucuronide carrier protein